MKPLKALIIGNCPQFQQRTSAALERSFESAPVVSGAPGKTIELMCRHQPSLIVISVIDAAYESTRIAKTIWSIEPNTRIVFVVSRAQQQLAAELYRLMPADAAAGFVLDSANSDEKLRSALQSLYLVGRTYIDQSLQEPEQCMSSAVA